ncbi:MAG: LicD family protein [Paracoccaceae bacterium]
METTLAHEQDRRHRVDEIRLMAYAALHGEATGFTPRKYAGELSDLETRPQSPAYLEALIGTCVVGRIRPSRTVRAMRKLRNLREAAGEGRKFQEFETLVQTHLGDLGVSGHGYGKAKFANMDHGKMWSRLGQHIAGLNAAGYEVFLNSGTLLGVVRDGRFIDHDDDIDLGVILKADCAEAAAAEWKAFKSMTWKEGLFDAASFEHAFIHKMASDDGCDIDLFPVWFEEGRAFVFPHTFGELAKEDVLPLKPCPVSGNPIPAVPEKMLAVNYGDGWREPDPYFSFPWPQARKKFAAFLEALE